MNLNEKGTHIFLQRGIVSAKYNIIYNLTTKKKWYQAILSKATFCKKYNTEKVMRQ